MKLSDCFRLARGEIRMEKTKLLLGLLLWIALLTVSLCIYRFSYSFTESLYQYMRSYDPMIGRAEYMTTQPLDEINRLNEIGVSADEIVMEFENNPHVRFCLSSGTALDISPFFCFSNQSADQVLSGTPQVPADNTPDSDAIWLGETCAVSAGVQIGDAVQMQIDGKTVREYHVRGTIADAEASIPGLSYLDALKDSGLFLYGLVTVTLRNPAAFYNLQAHLKERGIILSSDFGTAFQIIEVVSEMFWLIAVICMLLAILSLVNYSTILISERKDFILLLKTLGMKEGSLFVLYYLILNGLFILSFAAALCLQQLVSIRFNSIYESLLRVHTDPADHFVQFAAVTFILDLIFVFAAFYLKGGKLIYADDISAAQLRDE